MKTMAQPFPANPVFFLALAVIMQLTLPPTTAQCQSMPNTQIRYGLLANTPTTTPLPSVVPGIKAPDRLPPENDGPKLRDPKRAATLSAILPGLGQAYNQKYWKIPVVYAALGTSTYMIISNNREYTRYRNAYIARTDGDTTTTSTLPYTTENIKLRREYYLRNLELSIIITAGLYLLNIVDATVDAHLFYFDVSDDLSLMVRPQYNALAPGRYHAGLNVKLSF